MILFPELRINCRVVQEYVYVCTIVCMGLYGSVWVCTSLYGSVQQSVWVCMGLYRSVQSNLYRSVCSHESIQTLCRPTQMGTWLCVCEFIQTCTDLYKRGVIY